ncbi:zinc finger Y-chromosomal protein 2-like [Schistocerca nitens]|uniref:zinc finger Y-chromosomal protein 2-like n=1 Tax=Schistocerca nitens TaxID=7011 RepID=UPI0021178D9C|nr:zinc finger Y-chromosomal protein 2-like [Schistocerca nitens]
MFKNYKDYFTPMKTNLNAIKISRYKVEQCTCDGKYIFKSNKLCSLHGYLQSNNFTELDQCINECRRRVYLGTTKNQFDLLLSQMCFRDPWTQTAGSKSPYTRRFECTKCGKSYMQKKTLNRHVKLECDKKPQFSCPYCPHRSKQKSNLQQHIIAKHTGL